MREKRIIYLIMGVCSILILLIGITTAWFSWQSETNTNVSFNVEGLNITYEGEPTVIKGSLYPTNNMNNPDNIIHNFSLVTTSKTEIYSKMSLEIVILPAEINHKSFRWNLYKESTEIASGSFQNASVGTDLLLTPSEKITTTKSNYTLYIWIDGEHYNNPLTMGNQPFEFKLKLEASQQDYVTREECFVFDESTGTITDYLCVDGNTKSLPVITDVVIPNSINGVSVTKIGNYAFRENNLTSVVILNSVTTIGGGAFELNKLTSVDIPDSVTTIGDYAFSRNTITSATIGSGLTTINTGAFDSNNLTSVVIPASVTTISDNAFYDNKLTSVVIPDSVTSIGRGAFQNNNLISVVIPDSVTKIGNYAFCQNALTSVVIPDSITTIGDSTFRNNKLTSVIIPDGVTAIESYAFRENTLTSVVIPDSVKTISIDAFFGNRLTSVTIPDSVTTIGEYAFGDNLLTSVVIPDSVTTIGGRAFYWNELSSVYIGANSNLTETTGIGELVFASNRSNLTIYNNSGKKFKWYYVTQGRNDSTEAAYNFITGTVPSYNNGSTTYKEVTITTGGNP